MKYQDALIFFFTKKIVICIQKKNGNHVIYVFMARVHEEMRHNVSHMFALNIFVKNKTISKT
jgi:hypothetical protein